MPLIAPTPHGLYCEEGGFHIDPWSPVDRAVITHAHSDHAAPGSRSYLTAAEGVGVLRLRMGESAMISGLEYGQAFDSGSVRVSLHPAGHILGSAQVRIERTMASPHGPAGEVWVFSGDYKTDADATCHPFEPVRCHTFITESTFGLPIYRWPRQQEVLDQINAWWRANQSLGRTSVVYAYTLGKAQRVLAGLDPSIGPIGAHGAVLRINEAYERAGIKLPRTIPATGESVNQLQGRGIVLAPPSTAATVWLRRLGGPDGVATAFVSGWMMVRGTRRRRHVDRGFVLSDHADWPALLDTINATGAKRIGLTHGHAATMARFLGEQGRETFVVPSRFEGEAAEVEAEPLPVDGEG
jgi:putative mRNA 3-end processing factor